MIYYVYIYNTVYSVKILLNYNMLYVLLRRYNNPRASKHLPLSSEAPSLANSANSPGDIGTSKPIQERCFDRRSAKKEWQERQYKRNGKEETAHKWPVWVLSHADSTPETSWNPEEARLCERPHGSTRKHQHQQDPNIPMITSETGVLIQLETRGLLNGLGSKLGLELQSIYIYIYIYMMQRTLGNLWETSEILIDPTYPWDFLEHGFTAHISTPQSGSIALVSKDQRKKRT